MVEVLAMIWPIVTFSEAIDVNFMKSQYDLYKNCPHVFLSNELQSCFFHPPGGADSAGRWDEERMRETFVR